MNAHPEFRILPVSMVLGLAIALFPGGGSLVKAQEVTCAAGFAGPYACSNVDLQAIVPSSAHAAAVCGTSGSGADIWGWTDPETGREYAVQSLSDAVVFVDVTEPASPEFVGCLPAPVTNMLWRDVKVFDNHAYVVGDFSPFSTEDSNPDAVHGLQIFDLTRLRTALAPQAFTEDAIYVGFDEAHNIGVNADTGFIYVGASDTCGGGMHILDANADPKHPEFVGCFDDGGINVHDTQCVIYHGSDVDYRGHEICINSNEDFLDIVDVTKKNAAVRISRRSYAGQGYVHQGWLTEDHRYFLLSDETDELDSAAAGAPHNTHTYLWDMSDLDNPLQLPTYVGPTGAIDHNLYVRGNFVYQSNYTAGLRILDISGIASGDLDPVAYFDTNPPDEDAPVFAGLWSSYVYFDSGIVVSSQIDSGNLFVLEPELPEPDNGDATVRTTGGGWLADVEGGKVNFGFRAREDEDGTSGNLQFNDKNGGAKIKIREVTTIRAVQGVCGAITDSPHALEFHGSGTYNDTAAGFRVCVEEDGNIEDGTASDIAGRFHLECTTGCNYSTASRVPDDGIDGGNIQVDRGDSESVPSGESAVTVILNPLLLDAADAGDIMLFEARVYDARQDALAGATVTLQAVDADGTDSTLQTVTGSDGRAWFSLTVPAGVGEYRADSGDARSNFIRVTAL